MYVTSVKIADIRSLKRLKWRVPSGAAAGWHVILGNNGSGKSTLLRAIALALAGPKDAAALRQRWDDWLRRGAKRGSIELELEYDAEFDRWSGKGRLPNKPLVRLNLKLHRRTGASGKQVELDAAKSDPDPARHAWGENAGWFAASYGPFRRFGGGDPELNKLYYQFPRLARHLSIFDEKAALSESLEWLRDLKFKKLEKSAAGSLFDAVCGFVNQEGFLPDGVRLKDVTSEAVFFQDAAGARIAVEQLSDGYRSILSMTLELIRQLAGAFPVAQLFSEASPGVVQAPGVVLIDEVDVHLHPSWQRQIGPWMRRCFPRTQFIVTTHSPLVCQAAEVGSVFMLPKAGDDDLPRMLRGKERDRLLYGNILDAYATAPFARSAERSPRAKQNRKRLAELNVKELHKGLSNAERTEQSTLRAALPTRAAALEAP